MCSPPLGALEAPVQQWPVLRGEQGSAPAGPPRPRPVTARSLPAQSRNANKITRTQISMRSPPGSAPTLLSWSGTMFTSHGKHVSLLPLASGRLAAPCTVLSNCC